MLLGNVMAANIFTGLTREGELRRSCSQPMSFIPPGNNYAALGFCIWGLIGGCKEGVGQYRSRIIL